MKCNYYNKLRELRHQNYIGSEKCEACDSNNEMWVNKFYEEKQTIRCVRCKGKGYIIPLEFGCEVKRYNHEFNEYEICIVQDKEDSYGQINLIHNIHGSIGAKVETLENLGKPLTLQMVLRLLDKKKHGFSQNGVGEIVVWKNDEIHICAIDLTKDPKDWSEETLQAIIDMVN